MGQLFSVQVNAGSSDKALNAIAGTLSFPADTLEAVAVNKTNSILSYWVTEPVITNTTGTVKFEGVVPNPGFIGPTGQAVSITFRGKKPGSAPITFASGSILANDGAGTEILSGMSGATFTIVGTPVPPPPVIPAVTRVPAAPKVTSSTHPDPEVWYASSAPAFAWSLGADIDGVNFVGDKIADNNPGTKSDGLISKYQYDDVSDGQWYFHLRLRNAAGWGEITHFGFKIDTTKPEQFEASLLPRQDAGETELGVLVAASDKTSGIDHYEFSLDGSEAVIWEDDGNHLYRFNALPGNRTLIARAVDKAGNYLEKELTFTVDGLTPPVLDPLPPELPYGDTLGITGSTYPNLEVYLTVAGERGEKYDYRLSSDPLGKFSLAVEQKLKEGEYRVSAFVMNDRGLRSDNSAPVIVKVKLSSFWKLSLITTNVLAVTIPILALLLLLFFLIWYAWHKMRAFKKRLRKETREAEQALHQAFDLLRTDLVEGVDRLETAGDKRELTRDEKALLRQFRKSLDEAEKFVRKEIMDIEKEVD